MLRSTGDRLARLGALVARVQRCVAASTDLGGGTSEHRYLDTQLAELERDVEVECDRLTVETLTREHQEKLRRRA